MRQPANHALAAALLLVLLSFPASAAIDIVKELGGADNLQRFCIFSVASFLGMVGHYLKKWLRDEIHGSLLKYLVYDYPRQTLLTLITLGTTVVTMYFNGALDGLTFGQMLMLAGTTGYAVDSAVNKSLPSAKQVQAYQDSILQEDRKGAT